MISEHCKIQNIIITLQNDTKKVTEYFEKIKIKQTTAATTKQERAAEKGENLQRELSKKKEKKKKNAYSPACENADEMSSK